ncbi:transcription factor EGL1 isoform X2 [Juglans microcarpa x Juglans regia]|uniref:transcription factor EGL1 isoform X2 n=1 Tax=Juglans microcarpa x Juglans regia TaxID=2249226 RepID=UPI001B7F03BF|nr:transcription factor EGL1 isoform X2 [Juglans microcarpa x Juglans regia]
MATALQMEGRMLENLKKQLALAVRNIQWSYGIFWSISARQPGVLEWGDGYYNGDIKTRKTTQAMELNADQLGLQRSEQLRELYESLSIGEANPQSRRPSVALSPEDLSDPEWYYLVCMSFVFNIGQGLPGRTLANGQPTWLCNAHFADSKVFSRSLLAKTVICFPFLGGVVELGVTESVLEDPSLIQHVKTSFLEIPYSTIISRNSMMGAGSTMIDNNPACTVLDQDILQNKLISYVGSEELGINVSPNNSSNGFELSQPAEGSFMVEGINGGASQVQSWQFVDDEFSNCVLHSMNSSDCISQTFVEPEKAISTPKGELAKQPCLQDLQECNHTKMNSLVFRSDDLHYQGVLSSLLKSSHQSILGPCFKNYHHESSFSLWNKGDLENFQRGGTPQMLLKKVLIAVPQMHAVGLPESPEDICKRDEVWRPEADEIGANSALAERRRREKLNERFLILRSLVPSISKEDKVSILDDAIEYVKELERRVEELGSCRELAEVEVRTKRKSQDTVERISDNCGDNNISNSKKPLINKRKACDIDETEPVINYNVSKESSTDTVTVSMINKEVLIEMRCPWKEGVLLEIMDAVSNLQLDCHSVQSSTSEGILLLTIKSKFKGSVVVSAGIIKQSLQRLSY